jgi:hypothetical protein
MNDSVVGVNWHDVAYIHKPKENGYSETWNKSVILWFFTCYLVLGVILCNLLTTLIVEFHKVACNYAAACSHARTWLSKAHAHIHVRWTCTYACM